LLESRMAIHATAPCSRVGNFLVLLRSDPFYCDLWRKTPLLTDFPHFTNVFLTPPLYTPADADATGPPFRRIERAPSHTLPWRETVRRTARSFASWFDRKENSPMKRNLAHLAGYAAIFLGGLAPLSAHADVTEELNGWFQPTLAWSWNVPGCNPIN